MYCNCYFSLLSAISFGQFLYLLLVETLMFAQYREYVEFDEQLKAMHNGSVFVYLMLLAFFYRPMLIMLEITSLLMVVRMRPLRSTSCLTYVRSSIIITLRAYLNYTRQMTSLT